ncbi:MAG: T9SS type A sorting domain-containing protein [candidate division Zixibacteria bacterium]|nr:T9SS type A sorting domain-containing protein [candidate division Zixibacteria bacterium]
MLEFAWDTGSTDVEIDPESALPESLHLFRNYPNPFNPEMAIEFDLPRRSRVSIVICNSLGQVVTDLVNKEYPAGSHRVSWDRLSSSGERVSTGIYFYRLVAGDFINTKKMLLLK